MHLSSTLFACATLIAATVAQTPTTTSLHFTTIPTSLVAGVQQTIGWAGGNGNGVNIVLEQGPASNLQIVPIPPIASGAEGNSITWTPPKSLPDAGNYALRIEQGEDTVNYSGMLQLFGGCSTCPTNAAAAFASASTSKPSTGSVTASSSSSSTASPSSKSGAGIPVVAPGSNSSNSTGAASSSSNSTTATGSGTNSTMSTGSTANMTISGTNSTGSSTGNSTGSSTGNSTLSSAKPHATSSKSSSSSSSSSSTSSTSSPSSESTSSSTGSSPSPSPTRSNGVTVAASNFALVLCAIVGVVYLG